MGSVQNTLAPCGTSATCTAAEGANQTTCDTALAADTDGTACTAEATCTYVAACAVQPWAHCSVLNQKVTVNVIAAADPADPDTPDPAPAKASGAATVGVTMGAATAMASLLF